MKLSNHKKEKDMLTDTQTNTLSINDVQIHYEVMGQGTPIILCHAGFVDSQMWNPQMASLAQDYQVIRYDLQGYGQSSPATQPISRRHELLAIMEHLEIDQAILVGCSLSGATIIDFTLEYPKKVSGLVTVSATPSGFELQGEPPAHLFEMFGALQQGDLDTASELQTRIWFDGMTRTPEQVDAELRQDVKAMNLNAIQKHGFMMGDAQPLNPLDPPAITRLSEINVPTLILVGALDHPEIARSATLIRDAIANAKMKILESSAHLPNMEQADEFNQIVMGFLQGL
jgi:pimeloyl-ACP methyl ester carboxylesterase